MLFVHKMLNLVSCYPDLSTEMVTIFKIYGTGEGSFKVIRKGKICSLHESAGIERDCILCNIQGSLPVMIVSIQRNISCTLPFN